MLGAMPAAKPLAELPSGEWLSQLAQAIRDQELPYMTAHLLAECQTFVHADTNPSPRAEEGCNDDCVMAAAIAMEMYRLRGHHPARTERRKSNKRQKDWDTFYPWQQPTERSNADFDERYRAEIAV